jgi:hypothetical protein
VERAPLVAVLRVAVLRVQLRRELAVDITGLLVELVVVVDFHLRLRRLRPHLLLQVLRHVVSVADVLSKIEA